MDHEKFIKARREQLEEIRAVYEDKKILTRGQMEGKYKDFSEKYPKTWVNLMDGNFSIIHLERNLEIYENMYNKAKGNHYQKRFCADIDFGEQLAEKYLYPTMGKPDQEERKKAINEAKKQMEKAGQKLDKSTIEKLNENGQRHE